MCNLDQTTNALERHDEQLAKLAASMACDKGHECIKSGLRKIGKVECAAKGQVLFCLEEDAEKCRYWMPFGQGGLFRCHIRRYLAVNLDK